MASKIGDPEFGTFLEMLQTDLGFDSKQLCTFMCDGVASKIGDPELGASLEMLRTHWGRSPSKPFPQPLNTTAAA